MHSPPSARVRRVLLITSCLILVMRVFAADRRLRVLNVLRGRACKIVFEYVELIRPIPEFDMRLMEVVKYNKSLPVLNVEFVMKAQKAMEYQVWIDGYQKYGMEHIYRRSAISIHTKWCDMINGAFLFTSTVHNFSNLPHRCPLKLGELYYLRNFYVNEAATPPTFPGYQWRFDINYGPEGSKGMNNTLLFKILFRIEWYERRRPT